MTATPFAGYAPPPVGFAAPRAAMPVASAVGTGIPELVTVAATLLAVFAAVGLYTAAAISSVSSSLSALTSAGGGTTGDASLHLGSYALIWGFCGVVDLGLAYFIRQGNAMARIATSLVCAGWALYWLRDLLEISGAKTAAMTGLSPIVGVVELLVLCLAVASALPAVVLWLPSTGRHFS